MRASLRPLSLALLPCLGLAALLAPAPAAGQERAPPAPPPLPAPTGELLLSAVGERGDRVIHVPDVPAFLAAAEAAGLGPAGAWRTAFREQLTHWGSGEAPARMLRGAQALLKAADGEALFFSLPVPPVPGCGPRGTVLVLRTSAGEATLKHALEDLIAGGLGARYGGDARAEEISGRTVLALVSSERTLYLAAHDGLVAVADHPLALGLVYRGLESATNRPYGNKLMTVRRGRGERAWTGWMFGDRESLSGPLTGEPVVAPVPTEFPAAMAVAMATPGDMPYLPAPPPDWVAGVAAAGPVTVLIGPSGAFAVAGRGAAPPPGDGRTTVQGADLWLHAPAADAPPLLDGEPLAAVGAALRRGWLAALATGRLVLPIAGLDRELLAGPLAAAEAADATAPTLPWEARDTAGELRGPAFHGPATFLALRILHDTVGASDDDAAGASGIPLPAPRSLPPLPPPTDAEK